jgi:hypothetical protein
MFQICDMAHYIHMRKLIETRADVSVLLKVFCITNGTDKFHLQLWRGFKL